MTKASTRPTRCTYVVLLEQNRAAEDLLELARYLTELRLAECDVLVLDATLPVQQLEHRRVLRWVARIEPVRSQYRDRSGRIDILRAAADRSLHEKVIVADPDVRFSHDSLEQTLALLNTHEGVEPQEYIDPLPVWAAVDAAQTLLRRGLEPEPNDSRTFAFRRSTVRLLRNLREVSNGAHGRRFVASGGEVVAALDTFVRRRPVPFREWLGKRTSVDSAEFDSLPRLVAFALLLPALVFVAMTAGIVFAALLALTTSMVSVMIALRGRAGAGHAFPLRTAFLAPVWLVERSLSVYAAAIQRMRTSPAVEPDAGERLAQRAASGE